MNRIDLECLVGEHTSNAIVEAVGIMHLSVRVDPQHVDAVRCILESNAPIGWRFDVAALGYCGQFVRGIHIFA
ncbi:hypothetical protein D3C87_475520 [compost metagenome]